MCILIIQAYLINILCVKLYYSIYEYIEWALRNKGN